MFVWEGTAHEPGAIWATIPGHLKPHYRWFNTFISGEAGSWDNPLNHVLRVAEPDDYVIFKLDVDAYRIERPILQAILHSPDVAARVDELYFEHHVTLPEMTGYWGASAAADEDLRTSVELFTRLRQLGIRAHSWV
jgi:hypothetical protein